MTQALPSNTGAEPHPGHPIAVVIHREIRRERLGGHITVHSEPPFFPFANENLVISVGPPSVEIPAIIVGAT